LMTKLVTVFGGDGFVGRYVVQALLKSGARVRVASREPKRGWFLKAQADLGQIAWCAADVTRPDTVARAVEGADAVINLVGRFDDMQAVHVAGARNVAEAAAHAGVAALVHLSAIGADSASPSTYGRTKGDGEAAVRTAFSGAIILRPAIIFGREDQFINRFAGMIRMLPIVPVIRNVAKFQPVFVGDVAHGIAAAVNDPAPFEGKTLSLGGPEILSMGEINRWIAKATGRGGKLFVDVPDTIGALVARVSGWLPMAPINKDQWLMLQRDTIVPAGEAGLAAFGIEPTPLAAVAPGWLVQYQRHGRFAVSAPTT
jgi:uncharacterized protein YbjT (DUF2867 family)